MQLSPWCRSGDWVDHEIRSSCVWVAAVQRAAACTPAELRVSVSRCDSPHLDLEVGLHELHGAHPVLGPRLCGDRAPRHQPLPHRQLARWTLQRRTRRPTASFKIITRFTYC